MRLLQPPPPYLETGKNVKMRLNKAREETPATIFLTNTWKSCLDTTVKKKQKKNKMKYSSKSNIKVKHKINIINQSINK